MTTDDAMKIDYALVLKQLQRELDGLDERRKALLASVEAMKRLVASERETDAATRDEIFIPRGGVAAAHDSTIRMPSIPPDYFRGKTPTQAYRDLMALWPGHYKPPLIADLFMQGGMVTESRTGLVQAIHSVLKRERQRVARNNGHHDPAGSVGSAA